MWGVKKLTLHIELVVIQTFQILNECRALTFLVFRFAVLERELSPSNDYGKTNKQTNNPPQSPAVSSDWFSRGKGLLFMTL